MNSSAILSLIGDLYVQIAELTERLRASEQGENVE